jgi:hypothetical protein
MAFRLGRQTENSGDGKDWPNRRRHVPGARQYEYWPGQIQFPYAS